MRTIPFILLLLLLPLEAWGADYPPFGHVPELPANTQPAPGEPATTLAILGDLAPANAASRGHLKTAVEELNLLRPGAVFTVGDLINGHTREPLTYAAQVQQVRGVLDALTIPWYPCAGEQEIASPSRDPADRRFEGLYTRYFGPLYRSVDVADVHIAILDTEELSLPLSSPELSNDQLAWLASDLNAVFNNRKTAHVILIMHRPLWRDPKSNWKLVHQMLVAFNHRPIVSVEGLDDSTAPATGPRVEAVFAGHDRTYSDDGSPDEIHYVTLGATGALLAQEPTTGQLQGYALARFDSAGMHVSLMQPGNLHPSDFVIAADRQMAQQIEAFDEKTLGILGTTEAPLHQDVGPAENDAGPLRLMLKNPLAIPIDVEVRLASARNLNTANRQDTANPNTQNLDSPWELRLPYATYHLLPKTGISYHVGLACKAQTTEIPPPQVEFVVTFMDSKGRTVPVLLTRHPAIIPSGALAANGAPMPFALYAWDSTPPIPNPQSPPTLTWQLKDDALLATLQVEDPEPTYDGDSETTSDAVILNWEKAGADARASRQAVREIFYPFAPTLPKNVSVRRTATGYVFTLSLPAAFIQANAVTPVNLIVVNNGSFPQRWSWAREDLGSSAWGRLSLEPPATQPAH